MPLGRWLDALAAGLPVLGIVLSGLLVFVNSFYVTRVVVRNVIYLERTYMPAIIYLLVSSGYFHSLASLRPLLVALLVIIACEIVFRSYHYKFLASGPYLMVGFALGLAGAIYAPALGLVALMPVGLLIFRIFDLREWLAAMGGWLLPLFFSAYAVWLGGGEFLSIVDDARAEILSPGQMPGVGSFNLFHWIFAGAVATLFLLSLVTFTVHRRAYKLRPLKAYSFFIWMLLLWVAAMALLPSGSLYELPILAVPLSVIIPTYFSNSRPNVVSNLFYILLIVSAVAGHLFPFFE